MLTIAYFLTAVVIGSAAFLSTFAVRRKFPAKLPEFRLEEVQESKSCGAGVNLLRDERSFSERLGKLRVVTSSFHLIIKRY